MNIIYILTSLIIPPLIHPCEVEYGEFIQQIFIDFDGPVETSILFYSPRIRFSFLFFWKQCGKRNLIRTFQILFL